MNKSRKAFSLIEISIVILVVGILIAGISQGVDLYSDTKLTKAKTLTNNSIVGRIPDLAVWLETCLDKSTKKEKYSGNFVVGEWYDINPFSTNKWSALSLDNTQKPKYQEKGINNLPSLSFDGGNDYLSSNSIRLKGSKLTYFVVAKRKAKTPGWYPSAFDGIKTGVVNDWDNEKSFVGFYEGNNSQVDLYPAANNKDPLSLAPHPGNNVSYIASTIFNGVNNVTYLNGKSYTPVNIYINLDVDRMYFGVRWWNNRIRDFWNGEIGEIIIFTRDLTSLEHSKVLEYLSNKWDIKTSSN